jgi:hypothetical protein
MSIGGDADRLWNDWELDVTNTVELHDLAKEELERPGLRHVGLKAFASVVMGVDMDKPQWVRTGPWDAYWLSIEQIKYASIDTFVSFEVGRMLFAGDYD